MEAVLTFTDCLMALCTGALGVGMIITAWRGQVIHAPWQRMALGTMITAYALRYLSDAAQSQLSLYLLSDMQMKARVLWDGLMVLPAALYVLLYYRIVPQPLAHGVKLAYWQQTEARLQAENAQLAATVRALELRTEQMRSMHELGELFQAAQSIEDLGEITRRMACRLLPVDAGAIYASSAPGGEPQLVVAWGAKADPMSGHIAVWRSGLAYSATVARDHSHQPPLAQDQGWVCAPLRTQADMWGALVLHLPDPRPLSAEDPVEQASAWIIQSLADQAAIAFANLSLRTSLHEQAMHDPLTGLCNRRSMEAFFTSEIIRAAQQHSSIGVLMIDIDYFKRINDTYGHMVGDDALRLVARALKDSSRRSDVICRYGGEEFVVILPDVTAPVLAARAEQLRTAVAQVVERGELPFHKLSASVGIALYPQHGASTTAVLARADAALYAAKQRGRDQWVLADDASVR